LAGKGVKLDTAYIELQIDSSLVDKQVQESLDRAGTHAKDAGTKMGHRMREGIREGMKDVGKEVKSVGKDVADVIRDGLQNASPEFKKSIDAAVQQAAKGIGQKVGEAIGGSGFGKALQNMADQVTPVADKIRDALSGIQDHDAGKALGGIADALRGIGQTNAGNVIGDFGVKAGAIQADVASLKTNIEGTTTGLMTLTNNSGKIAGGLDTIKGAAGPLAIAFEGLKQVPGWLDAFNHSLDQLKGQRDFNWKDWANSLAPMTNLIDRHANSWIDPSSTPALPNSPNSPNGVPRPGLTPAGQPPGPPTVGGIPIPGLVQAGPQPGQASPPGPHRGGNAPSGLTTGGSSGGLNLSTIPIAAQRYANDCIDASARIILSHAGINMDEDQLQRVIAPGGSITSQAAGLNQLHPRGRFVPMAGSGGSQQAMFAAIKASIDGGSGSILNVAPGSSIAGRPFPEGHFIAVTGYNADGTLNLSDTAGGTQYSVSPADAFQATRGRGIVAGGGLPSFDKGTDGPLPEDMVAQLHKGEIVVPADQVDAAMAGGQDPNQPDGGPQRTEGYMPAAAASNAQGVAGTSSLAGLLDLGNQAAAGLIDSGAQAATAAAAIGGFGAGGAAAGPAIQMGAALGKRAVSYGFQALSIGADAAIEQLFPFGAPRWIGYDYTQFAPNLNISKIGVTTGEKAVESALQAQGVDGPPQGLDAAGMASQQPGGPVSAGQLIGSQPSTGPTPEFKDKPPAASVAPNLGTGPSGGPGTGAAPAPATGPQPQPAAPLPQLPKMSTDNLPSIAPLDIFGMDDGGWLPHNSAAYNSSGRPELMVPEQNLSDVIGKPTARQSGGDTYYITGMDPDGVMREVDKKKRLSAMRYTGRF
jgi:hypothetical protein